MSDHQFTNFIKDQALSNILDINQYTSCEYYDEEQFRHKLSNQEYRLNIFTLNIRSLPKHRGELVNFINLLQAEFQVIILSEIGSRNLTTVEHIFPNYSFVAIPPSACLMGGVGLYISEIIQNFELLQDTYIHKTCACSNCQYESLCFNFETNGQPFTILAIYRHPKGNISHFIHALETTLSESDHKRTLILTGDININLLNFDLKKRQ